jgi:hypothetical protein
MTKHLIGGLSILALVLAAAGCASTDHAAAPAAIPSAATSTATPTATFSAAPTSPPLTVTVSMTRKRPFVGTNVGVRVFTVPGARITMVAHFQTGDLKKSARADAAGVHTFWYQLGSATPGFRVNVNVRVSANGQKLSSRAWFTPRQRPPPPAPAPPPPSAAPPSGCYPKTNSGNCYEPGEFCRTTDHGMSGIAGDGEAIICEDNNGWRWEPA